MSKGSNRRPQEVETDKFEAEWDRIFGVSKYSREDKYCTDKSIIEEDRNGRVG